MAVDFISTSNKRSSTKPGAYEVEYTAPGSTQPVTPVKPQQLPPAPPPPVPAPVALPVAPVQPKPVALVLPTPPVPLVPVKPVVKPTPPAAPAPTPIPAPTPMAASSRHATNVGEVVAQNVSHMRGAMTQPAALVPGAIGVNLLPNSIQQPLQQQASLYRLLRLSTVTVLLVTLVYLGMVGYQAWFLFKAQAAIEELNVVDQKILTYTTLQNEVNATNDTLVAVQGLLDQQMYWTQWLQMLEQTTLPSVGYSGFSGNASGVMTLQAVAPDFTTITQQLAVWRNNPAVTEVSVTNVSRSDSGVQFNLSLQVDPAVLKFQPNGAYEQSQ